MLIDMHVHTTVSACSRLTLAEVLANSRRRGLDGVCITDHDSMAAARCLREGRQPDGLYVFFGLEYATPDGDFLVFGPFEELARRLSARRLLDEVAAAGGVSIAAHPFRHNRPVGEYLVREGCCRVVESVNGRNRAPENQAVEGWRRQYAQRRPQPGGIGPGANPLPGARRNPGATRAGASKGGVRTGTGRWGPGPGSLGVFSSRGESSASRGDQHRRRGP